ncbi:MAG: hypothetical protein ABJ056_02580 [Halioglobus sp.]
MRLVIVSVVALIPWLIAMYFLFWLDREQIWTVFTPYRDIASLGILVVGMSLSFISLCGLMKRK